MGRIEDGDATPIHGQEGAVRELRANGSVSYSRTGTRHVAMDPVAQGTGLGRHCGSGEGIELNEGG